MAKGSGDQYFCGDPDHDLNTKSFNGYFIIAVKRTIEAFWCCWRPALSECFASCFNKTCSIIEWFLWIKIMESSTN